MAAERILITGASGFLGSHLCDALSRSGAEIHCVSRVWRQEESTGIRWWAADLTDVEAVHSLWKQVRPDLVFHFSALSSASPDLPLVLPTLTSILVSTVNVLTVSAQTGCRRILLPASMTEPPGTSIQPGSPYAAAKSASSAYARMFHALYGTPVVIVRPFMTFGPRQDVRKLVPYVTLCLLRGETPKLSSGALEADWIYIDDVIQGFLAAARMPNLEGAEIDLGTGELVSVRNVVKQLVELTGSNIRPVFGALPDRPLEQARRADTANAWAKLEWRPTTSLPEGLQRTIDWYREYIRFATADASA